MTKGLASAGYRYVDVDNNRYQCPGFEGPGVDPYGRWAINGTEYPGAGSENGIQAVAGYVHSLGLAGVEAQKGAHHHRRSPMARTTASTCPPRSRVHDPRSRVHGSSRGSAEATIGNEPHDRDRPVHDVGDHGSDEGQARSWAVKDEREVPLEVRPDRPGDRRTRPRSTRMIILTRTQ